MRSDDDLLRDQVRALHAPSAEITPVCLGCEFDGYEAECPVWPCATAQLVYTPEEITEAQARGEASPAPVRDRVVLDAVPVGEWTVAEVRTYGLPTTSARRRAGAPLASST